MGFISLLQMEKKTHKAKDRKVGPVESSKAGRMLLG